MKEKWYEYKPEIGLENDKCKLLWDFTLQKDHKIHRRIPDAIVLEKDKNLCQ